MVNFCRKPSFLSREDGVVTVEGLAVLPLVLLAFSAFFEFGFVVFQWNQTVKALQLGARLVAVSNPLIENVPTKGNNTVPFFEAFSADYTGDPGDPVPVGLVKVVCGAPYEDEDPGDIPACNSTQLERLVFGSDGKCSTSYGSSLPGMCDFNKRIQPSQVRVTYFRSGLGFQGRPGGPVLTISVEVPNLTFQLGMVGLLIEAMIGDNDDDYEWDGIQIPTRPVTITSEDLLSCRDRVTCEKAK